METLVRYDVNEADIATMRERCAGLDARVDYEAVRVAIGQLRGTRTAIEKRRVDLKADALAYGRKVDAVAKELTAKIEAIEEPLRVSKLSVDDEKARAKRAAEEAELRALEAKLREERAAEEARLKAERDALAAQLAIEKETLRVERARLAEEQRVERERQVVEQAKLDEVRRAVEAAQFAQAQAIRQEQEALAQARRELAEREQAERDRLIAEAQRVADEKRAAEAAIAGQRALEERTARAEAARVVEEARLEALRPDIDRIHAFGQSLRLITFPKTQSDQAQKVVNTARMRIEAIAEAMERWAP